MNMTKFAATVGIILLALVALFRFQPDVMTIAFGSPMALQRLLTIASPLLMTGLAVHACLTTGRILIAGEGIYAAGGIAVAIVGTTIAVSPAGLYAGLAAAFVIGSVIGLLICWLRDKKGVHEVISGLLLNYLVQLLTRYLATNPYRDQTSDAPHTRELPWTLPLLSSTSDLNIVIIVGGVVLVIYAYFINKTPLGRVVRSLSSRDGVALTAGLNPTRTRMIVMSIASGLVGLSGAIVIASAGPFRRFPADFYGSGVGFDGLLIGLLSGPSILMLLPSTLLVAGLSHLSDALSLATALPRQVGSIISATLFITVAVLRYRKQHES